MSLVTRYQAHYINRPYCGVSVVFCVRTDWKSVDEPPPKKQKKNGADNEARREEYYQQLKESVGSNSVNTSVDKAEPSIHKYQQLATKEEVVRQMMDVFSVIKVNERKVIEYYAMLGCVLTQLKFLNITTKCDDCQLQDDIYVVLKCASCNDGKKNPTSAFYGLVEDKTKYKRNFTDFLISFGKLYIQYPKLATCDLSVHKIKNNITMEFLKKKMSEDEEFWK